MTETLTPFGVGREYSFGRSGCRAGHLLVTGKLARSVMVTPEPMTRACGAAAPSRRAARTNGATPRNAVAAGTLGARCDDRCSCRSRSASALAIRRIAHEGGDTKRT